MRSSQIAKGFTLIELLVVISIIALLIAILLPTLASARRAAVTTQCLARIRDVGMTLQLYANDQNDKLPSSVDNANRWPRMVAYYYNRRHSDPDFSPMRLDFYRCPTQVEQFGGQNNAVAIYGYNNFFRQDANANRRWSKLTQINQPSTLPLLGDANGEGGGGLHMEFTGPHPVALRYGWGGPTNVSGPAPNHGGYTNYVFADQHAETRDIWPWRDFVGTDFHPKGDVTIVP